MANGTTTYWGDTPLDALASAVSSGTTAYGPTDNTGMDTGALVNTAASPVRAPADASGGNGSFLSQLQDTLVNGLTDATGLATDFALGSMSDRVAVNAAAQTHPAAAPATKVVTQPTWIFGALIALAVLGAFLLADRR